MQVEGLTHEIEAMRDRAIGLYQKVNQLPVLPHSWLSEVFEEVGTALEDLQVAQEELLQQNEELAAARQAVEAQRQRYQGLFDFAPEAYLVTDAKGMIQEANHAATTLLESSWQSPIGKSLVRFVPWEERKTFRSQLNQLSQKIGTVQEWEVRLSPACHGEPFDAALRVAAFQDPQNQQISLRWLVRDITLAKQAQAERLRESENRWRTIVETEPECVKIVASDGTLLDMNPAGLAMIEATSIDCAMGQSVYSLIAPEHREAFVAFNESVCQGNKGILEFEIIGLRGTRRWMETHAVPLRRETDVTLVHLAITRDITERKQAEAALKQAKQELEIRVEERTAQLKAANDQLQSEVSYRKQVQEELERSLSLLRGTLEGTADGIIVSQNGTYIATVNQKFVEMWGIPEAVIASRELNRVVPLIVEQLKDPETFLSGTLELLSQPDAEGYGIIELKDGRIFERYSLPQWMGGNIVGRVCSFRDITERQRAEEALKQAKQELEIKVEERTAQLKQVVRRLQSEIEERKQAQEELQRSTTELELTLRELQQTQAKLVQSEKMSSLGQLIAGVAHEINNPLNFIYGNLSHVNQYARDLFELVQLYQEYHSHSAAEIQACTEEIELDFIKEDLPKIVSSMQMGADRIREIVLSLRNFSHVDEARMKPADIHEGLEDTLLILAHRLKATADRPAIEIIKEYGNLPKVECYAGQLNQVFMNILNNAIDAITSRFANDALEDVHSSWFRVDGDEQSTTNNQQLPKIWIRTEVNDCDRVMIRIADNGCGMSEEVAHKLFDPFFTTKPVGSGTGLGMSISYQIVEKHGGQLTCISESGQGTEFQIEIPIHRIERQVRK